MPPRQFKINHTSFTRHYTVLDPAGAPLYHVDQSAFTHNKANLTLHRGGDTSAPVVAAVHLPRVSFTSKIALGDPNSAEVVWEDLTRESRDTSAHQFSVTLPSSAGGDGGGGGGEGVRKTFTWKRTHKVSADGLESSRLTMRDLKLVDDATGEVVGMFTSKRGWSSCGTLQMDVDYGNGFDVMATATMLAIYERARKRRARTAAAAGGGG